MGKLANEVGGRKPPVPGVTANWPGATRSWLPSAGGLSTFLRRVHEHRPDGTPPGAGRPAAPARRRSRAGEVPDPIVPGQRLVVRVAPPPPGARAPSGRRPGGVWSCAAPSCGRRARHSRRGPGWETVCRKRVFPVTVPAFGARCKRWNGKGGRPHWPPHSVGLFARVPRVAEFFGNGPDGRTEPLIRVTEFGQNAGRDPVTQV
jgi:hypothetical protein